MKQTIQESKIAAIIEPAIKDLGFDLIQVRVIGSQKLQTLQVMAEDPKTGLLDLNGCTAISREISALLDVEDPIAGAYQLEVSSPGIDRPLTRAADFEKHKGEVVSIETDEPAADGQKRFKGKISEFDGTTVTLTTEDGEVQIALGTIIKAKLVLTDELLEAVMKKKK